MSEITPEIVAEHGLSPEEYERVLHAMGRTPNLTELGIFSVMWSEHCSYKSSRIHLKKLPTTGPQVICGPGENAGVVDIGDGQAAIFYFHPWELDVEQPRIPGIDGKTRFRHYLNLHRTERRLKQLLSDFVWGRVDEVFPIDGEPVVEQWPPLASAPDAGALLDRSEILAADAEPVRAAFSAPRARR